MNLYTFPAWSSAYPTNIPAQPLVSSLDLIFFPSLMAITAISPNVLSVEKSVFTIGLISSCVDQLNS